MILETIPTFPNQTNVVQLDAWVKILIAIGSLGGVFQVVKFFIERNLLKKDGESIGESAYRNKQLDSIDKIQENMLERVKQGDEAFSTLRERYDKIFRINSELELTISNQKIQMDVLMSKNAELEKQVATNQKDITALETQIQICVKEKDNLASKIQKTARILENKGQLTDELTNILNL